jgi:hypothetical protein
MGSKSILDEIVNHILTSSPKTQLDTGINLQLIQHNGSRAVLPGHTLIHQITNCLLVAKNHHLGTQYLHIDDTAIFLRPRAICKPFFFAWDIKLRNTCIPNQS